MYWLKKALNKTPGREVRKMCSVILFCFFFKTMHLLTGLARWWMFWNNLGFQCINHLVYNPFSHFPFDYFLFCRAGFQIPNTRISFVRVKETWETACQMCRTTNWTIKGNSMHVSCMLVGLRTFQHSIGCLSVTEG